MTRVLAAALLAATVARLPGPWGPADAVQPRVAAQTAAAPAAGATVVTTGGAPVTIGNLRIALVRDPNNLLLELMQ